VILPNFDKKKFKELLTTCLNEEQQKIKIKLKFSGRATLKTVYQCQYFTIIDHRVFHKRKPSR